MLVEQAAEPIPPQNTYTGHLHSRIRSPERILVQRPVRPVAVIVIHIPTPAEAGSIDRRHVDTFAHIVLGAASEVALIIARRTLPPRSALLRPRLPSS
jgi:hypothetical protein